MEMTSSTNPKSLEEKAAELAEELGILPDVDARFEYLIRLGRHYPAMDDSQRREENLLPGCVSQLWLLPEVRDGACVFHMDADAQITKGLAAVVCGFYSGASPEEVARIEPTFLEETGLTQQLTPNRRNGLGNLRARIRGFAEKAAAG